MSRRLSLMIAAALLLSGCSRAHMTHLSDVKQEELVSAIVPPAAKFPIGEKLVYQISWWNVPVGTATLTTEEFPKEKLVRIRIEARSNWYLETFYPVRVELTSMLDPETVQPRRFEAHVKRRARIHNSTITFDWNRMTAFHELPKGKTAEVPLAPNTQDGISMVYYARTIPFQLGQTIPLFITADGKNWELKGQIVEASMIKIGKLGRFPAVEGQVELAYPVPFFHGAQAHIWYSADSQRIPLMAKIDSRIGPVTVVLIERSTNS